MPTTTPAAMPALLGPLDLATGAIGAVVVVSPGAVTTIVPVCVTTDGPWVVVVLGAGVALICGVDDGGVGVESDLEGAAGAGEGADAEFGRGDEPPI